MCTFVMNLNETKVYHNYYVLGKGGQGIFTQRHEHVANIKQPTYNSAIQCFSLQQRVLIFEIYGYQGARSYKIWRHSYAYL